VWVGNHFEVALGPDPSLGCRLRFRFGGGGAAGIAHRHVPFIFGPHLPVPCAVVGGLGVGRIEETAVVGVVDGQVVPAVFRFSIAQRHVVDGSSNRLTTASISDTFSCC